MSPHARTEPTEFNAELVVYSAYILTGLYVLLFLAALIFIAVRHKAGAHD